MRIFVLQLRLQDVARYLNTELQSNDLKFYPKWVLNFYVLFCRVSIKQVRMLGDTFFVSLPFDFSFKLN